MRVGRLIEILKELPDDAIVGVYEGEVSGIGIDEVVEGERFSKGLAFVFAYGEMDHDPDVEYYPRWTNRKK